MKKKIEKMSTKEKLIFQNSEILSSEKDKTIFFEALVNPPKPNKDLLKAAKLFKKHSA